MSCLAKNCLVCAWLGVFRCPLLLGADYSPLIYRFKLKGNCLFTMVFRGPVGTLCRNGNSKIIAKVKFAIGESCGKWRGRREFSY